MESVFRIMALIRKELLAILKDPRSRVVLIMPPLFQTLMFGYAASFDLNTIPFVVLDQDRSAASSTFLGDLDGSPVFQRIADIHRAGDIKKLIDNRDALVAVQIGPDFERNLRAGRQAAIQVIVDGRNSNTAATALGYVNAIVASFNQKWSSSHRVSGPSVRAIVRAWYNENLETRWHMIPALIGTITMLQTMLLTALSVAREREDGTFDQLLVTPFKPAEIMVGKAVPSTLIGLIQATIILLVAQLWFAIPFAGSFLTLYAGLILFLVAAVGIGLLVSAMVATMQQAMLFSFMLLMPFILLSGISTPIGNMPEFFQYLTLVNPLRYAIDLTHRVYLEGATLRQLIPVLWPLAAIGAVTLPVAAWLFRNRLS
ncbi:MAG: ABC transporter permease [Salaquimonas sp.]|jgi:ABC-2 type transport system permease protein|nr:ABC transporter permease [Salaquimonas sp.]